MSIIFIIDFTISDFVANTHLVSLYDPFYFDIHENGTGFVHVYTKPEVGQSKIVIKHKHAVARLEKTCSILDKYPYLNMNIDLGNIVVMTRYRNK